MNTIYNGRTRLDTILFATTFFTLIFLFAEVAEAQTQAQTNLQLNQVEKPKKPIIKVQEFHYSTEKQIELYINKEVGATQSESRTVFYRTANSNRSTRIILPEMIGGLQKLYSHINYPVHAKSNGIEGKVTIEFVVNELGMVEDAVITEGIGGGCDEEVLFAMKKMRFSPAIQNGRFKKVKLTQSILFELKNLRK